MTGKATRNLFDAAVFDLDGVITRTAVIHSAAWKKVFDDFLKQRSAMTGDAFREFTHSGDYLAYVDGKPRYKGVESFLASRNLTLPPGDASDPPGMETVCGLGNLKNLAFNEVLEKDGVEVFDSTIALIQALKERQIKVAVASSSKNCKEILIRAGLLELFDARVDGVVSAEMNLKGKPEPDIFTKACEMVGVPVSRAMVVEDAVSGVQAGRKGNFGLVLGIARENNHRDLRVNGADRVVGDLSEITIEDLENWFRTGLQKEGWTLSYHDYDPAKERSREALLTVGNGYFGTRGAVETTLANPVNYPGTYLAGVYNRLTSHVGDRDIENEDLVNVPNWLCMGFRIGNGEWFDINTWEIRHIARTLDFRTGVLKTDMLVRDREGRETRLESERIAGMHNPHLASMVFRLKAVNYSEKIILSSGLNGSLINEGIERYRQLNQKHLEPVSETFEGDEQGLLVRTTGSDIQIAEAARTIVFAENLQHLPWYYQDRGFTQADFTIRVPAGEWITAEKVVAIYTSRDAEDPLSSAFKAVRKAGSYGNVAGKSAAAWKALWKNMDVRIMGDRLAQKLLRLHLYHLMVSFSPHNRHLDASITARGLHGEAYRGHIFWDELFILPLYTLYYPEVTRAALLYRYRRLDTARAYARDHGYQGAMFPWQSGSDGREETQVIHLNPVSGKWDPDHSRLQRHVSLAIAYNIYIYTLLSGDKGFLRDGGLEMYLEICRFWASASEYDPHTGRYSIKGVMGPDEFHEKNPGAAKGGLTDNSYTNIMTAWTFDKAFVLMKKAGRRLSGQVKDNISLPDAELDTWKQIGSRLRLVISTDGILAQYDGYFGLEELDWDYFQKKYGNIHRMDRLLKAEGKTPDTYKVAKQADALMAFYNLGDAAVKGIVAKLGYPVPDDLLQKNFRYYLGRTSHGSSLSRLVHGSLAHAAGLREVARELYMEALGSDYTDIQGGTTGEGIHTGVMAGTVWVALTTFAGLRFTEKGGISICPDLPDHWSSISFQFRLGGHRFELAATNDKVRVRTTSDKPEITVFGRKETILPRTWFEFRKNKRK
jgi:beta-phosphoglucomutase family hydrolase